MPEIETSFSVEIKLYDEGGHEVDLSDYSTAISSVAQLIDESAITSFEEILGHLWMRIHFERGLMNGG